MTATANLMFILVALLKANHTVKYKETSPCNLELKRGNYSVMSHRSIPKIEMKGPMGKSCSTRFLEWVQLSIETKCVSIRELHVLHFHANSSKSS